jgi:hypothetical protein
MWFLIMCAIVGWVLLGLYVLYLQERKAGNVQGLLAQPAWKTWLQIVFWPLWLLWTSRPYWGDFFQGSLQRLAGFGQFLQALYQRAPWVRRQ